MDSAQSTELMTAALNGFKLSASDAMGVVDKFSALDLKYATSAEEIATALQYVASSAGLAGVGIDKMSALITVASSVTRLSAETIGNAWKSVTARMQNIKIGKFVDDDTSEALNDVEKVLNKLGIKLRDTNDSWRNMEDVLDDVGKKWNTYTDIEKSALATSIAGTRQRNVFIATMENYDKVLEATSVSATSAGTAQEKYAAISDSVDGKLNNLIATWDKLVNNLNQSGNFKGILDLGTSLVGMLDYGINKLNLLSAALVLVGGKLLGLGIEGLMTKFSTMSTATDGYVITLGKLAQATMLGNVETQKTQILYDGQVLNLGKLNQAQLISVISSNKELAGLKLLDAEKIEAVLVTQGVSAVIAKDTAIKLTDVTATGAATVATGGFTVVMKGLTAAIAANPIGFWLTLITTLLSVAIPLIQHFAGAEQDLANKSKELLDTFATQKATLDSNAKSISDVSTEYAKLRQGVDALNNNVSLSSTEYTRFLELNKQIAGVSPELVKGYDSQGNALLDLNGGVNAVVTSLTEMIAKQKESYNQSIVKDADNIWNGIKGKVDEYNTSLTNLDEIQKTINTNTGLSQDKMLTLSEQLDKLGISYTKVYKEAKNANEYGTWSFDFGGIDTKDVTKKISDSKNDIKKSLETELAKIQPVIQAKVELDDNYKKMGSQLQSVVTKAVSGLNFSKIGSNTTEISDYISKNIIKPISDNSPKIQEAWNKALKLQTDFSKGTIDKTKFTAEVNDLFKEAFSGVDTKTLDVLKNSLTNAGVEGNGLIQMFTNLLTPTKDETDAIAAQADALDSLSTTITTIVDKYNSLGDVIENINTHHAVSSDDMKAIIKNYSDLTPALLEYSAGIRSAANIEDLLKAKQKEQADAYKKNIQDQISNSTDFYTQKMAKENTLATQLEANYQIDYAKYTTFQQLKNAVDVAVLNKQIGLVTLSGKILADEYLADATNYGSFENGKTKISDAVRLNIEGLNEDKIRALAKQYGIDVGKYGDGEAAKAKITAEVTGKIVQMYAATNDGFKSTLQTQLELAKASVASMEGNGQDGGRAYINAQNSIVALQKALNGGTTTDTSGIQKTIDGILGSINTSIPKTTKEVDAVDAATKKAASTAKSEASAAETAANKAAAALKAKYELERKVIETAKDTGKYDVNKIGYYTALNSLQAKWAKSALDTEDKLTLQKDTYGALKDYQDDILKSSYDELARREDLNIIGKDSEASLQNLLEIQKNLNSSGMTLANTAEKQLELQKKILAVKKAIADSEQDTLDHDVSMGTVQENSIQYVQRLQAIYAKLNSSNIADKKDLWDLQEKIYDAEKAYAKEQLDNASKAIDKKIAAYQKQQDAIEKTYQKQIDADEAEIKSLDKKETVLEDLYQPQLDAIDAQTKALEKQEKLMENMYQPQIDALQKVLDEKEAENNLTDKSIALEKAKQDLAKAESQKVNRIYKQGEGFVFEADKTAVSDAKKTLDDLNYQAEIDAITAQKDKLQSSLDSEKKALEDQITTLNDYKTTLQDNWDAEKKVLDDQIKTLNTHKDNLQDIVDAEKKSIQDQIDSLNDYKDEWDELVDYYDENSDEFIKKMTNNNVNETGLLKSRLASYISQNTDFLDLFTTSNDNENSLLTDREDSYTESNQASLVLYNQKTADYLASQTKFLAQLSDGNSKENALLTTRLANLDSFRAKYAVSQNQIVATNSTIINSNDKLASSYSNAASAASNYIDSLASVAAAKSKSSSSAPNSNYVAHGAYADGGVDTKGGLNMLHGTPTSPETIFNATDSKKLYDVVHNNSNLAEYFTSKMETHNSKITSSNDKNVNITIGDVNLHEVENPDTAAKAIVEKLPASVLQALFSRSGS